MENNYALAPRRTDREAKRSRAVERIPTPQDQCYTNRKYRKQARKDVQFMLKSLKRQEARQEAQARQAQVKSLIQEFTEGDTR